MDYDAHDHRSRALSSSSSRATILHWNKCASIRRRQDKRYVCPYLWAFGSSIIRALWDYGYMATLNATVHKSTFILYDFIFLPSPSLPPSASLSLYTHRWWTGLSLWLFKFEARVHRVCCKRREPKPRGFLTRQTRMSINIQRRAATIKDRQQPTYVYVYNSKCLSRWNKNLYTKHQPNCPEKYRHEICVSHLCDPRSCGRYGQIMGIR